LPSAENSQPLSWLPSEREINDVERLKPIPSVPRSTKPPIILKMSRGVVGIWVHIEFSLTFFETILKRIGEKLPRAFVGELSSSSFVREITVLRLVLYRSHTRDECIIHATATTDLWNQRLKAIEWTGRKNWRCYAGIKAQTIDVDIVTA
jgi:hypothetical protein